MKAASTSPVTCPLWWAPCSLGGRPPLGHPLDLPLLCGLGAGPAPARGRVAAPAGGRGERGSRGGERGRRARGDLRNRKHLFALGGGEKKAVRFQQHRRPVAPPCPRSAAFPSSALLSHPRSLPGCRAAPGAGRERGDQLAQHLRPAARRALARTRAGCRSTRAPGARGRRELPGHAERG